MGTRIGEVIAHGVVEVGSTVVCTVCDGRGATRIKGPNGHEGNRAVLCGGCGGQGTQIVQADY